MSLQDRLDKIKPYDLNCNVFSVYDYCGVNIQELLSQFFTKINSCVDYTNGSLDLVKWLVEEGLSLEVAKQLNTWLIDGTLAGIINDVLLKEISDKVDKNVIDIATNTNDITNLKINVTDIGAQVTKNTLKLLNHESQLDNINEQLTNGLPIFQIPAPLRLSTTERVDQYNSRVTANNLKNRLRIGSFNIFGFRDKSPIIAKDASYLMMSEGCDIVGIQEFVERYDFSTDWWIKTFKGLDKSYYRKLMDLSGGTGGQGILSKHELINTTGGNFTPVADKETRGWCSAEILINGKRVKIFNTHLTHDDMSMLRTEMQELATIVANDPAQYKFITGDFNTRTLSDYSPFTNLGYQLALSLDTRTIDNVLYLPTTSRVITTKIIPSGNISDHDLVVAELELI